MTGKHLWPPLAWVMRVAAMLLKNGYEYIKAQDQTIDSNQLCNGRLQK
jgi:hypothetical protein